MPRDQIKIFSFDIFDTTVTRYVANPKDIFLIMQKKLQECGTDFPDKLLQHFASLRVKAEFNARLKAYTQKDTEISIGNIYENIRKKFQLDQRQVTQLIEIECDLEYQSIYPIAWTLTEINSLRKENKRIIFTSDMYLPLELIKKILLKVGAYHENQDRVYLSSSIGHKKFDGALFRYILDQEKCKPEEICHFGDDIQSDIFVPHKLGIGIYNLTQDQIRHSLRYYHFKKIKKYFRYIQNVNLSRP